MPNFQAGMTRPAPGFAPVVTVARSTRASSFNGSFQCSLRPSSLAPPPPPPSLLPCPASRPLRSGRIAPRMERMRRRPRLDVAIPENLFETPPLQAIDGSDFDFSTLKGKVVLVVNVASQDESAEMQFHGLNSLYERYNGAGLEIVAFPSNWYGQYEPGSDEEVAARIAEFGCKFTVMSKLANFDMERNPALELGRSAFPGEIIWNFEGKFLFNKAGKPVARFDLLTNGDFIEDKVAEFI